MTQLRKNITEQQPFEIISKKLTEENLRLKKENEDLRKAQAELNILFGSIDEVLYSVDMTSFKILHISAACEKVTGYSSEEFHADPDLWRKVVYPEDKEISKQQVQLLNRGEQVLNQYRIIHKDKSIHWIENKIIPTLDETGRLIRIDAVTTDITERKEAEKKLEESVSILEATIESTADGILVIDFDGNIVRVNKKFTELWRIPDEILILRDDEKALAYVSDQLENPQEFLSGVKKLYANQNDASFDVLKFKDGRIFERYSQPQIINGNYVGRVISFRDITVQKSSEKALKEGEKRLRQIIDLVPHFIFAKDTNGKFTIVNEAVAKAYGSTVEAIVGKSDADFNSNTKEVEHFIQKDLEVINSGVAKHNIEETITDAEGKTRVISTTKIPYRSLAGPGLLGVSVDITERKKADEALRLAQFTIENTTHAIYWIKSDGSFHMVNNAATQMLGFSFEELMQLNVPGIDPFYNKEVWDGFWQAIINQKYMRLITKHIRKDGTLIDVQIDTHYFKFENLEMSCAFVSDITEMKIAETLLKNSEEKYRQIVETAQEGIWLIDEDNYVSFVNKKMCEILGYSANEIKGRRLFDFMDEEGKVKALQNIEKTRESVTGNYDVQYMTKTGKPVWTNISTNSILDQDGAYKGALAMVTDITQRKLQEELLKKSEADLEIKNNQLEQKNKELEQFAYVASHDMQEPLRTTSSFVELLQQQYKGKLDEKADKYLTFIADSSERMKVLIKDLLDYSRIGRKTKLAEVDCNIMLKQVIADLGAAINEAGAEITMEQLPVVNGYPTEIKQLFQNLIINAIKFRQKYIPPAVKISAQKKSGNWEFSFADNGIGIAKEHTERIFIIFQRLHTRNEYEGSGIGLSHCKKIVELHKGKIWVESIPLKGSTFYFTIPENNIA